MAEPNPFADAANKPVAFDLPDGTITARQLLDQPVPDFNTKDGAASQSTDQNVNFEGIHEAKFDQHQTLFGADRGGYPLSLPSAKFYPIAQVNFGPTTHEAQAVNIARHYWLTPVSQVLGKKIVTGTTSISYHVEEEVKGIFQRPNNGEKANIAGYIDAAWLLGSEYIAFAEFKRPGALVKNHWITDGVVVRKAKTISQQVIKYSYATKKKYFIVSDAKVMIFLRFDNPSDGYVSYVRKTTAPPPKTPGVTERVSGSTRTGAAAAPTTGWPPVSVKAVWADDRTLYKPQLYAFVVKAALDKER